MLGRRADDHLVHEPGRPYCCWLPGCQVWSPCLWIRKLLPTGMMPRLCTCLLPPPSFCLHTPVYKACTCCGQDVLGLEDPSPQDEVSHTPRGVKARSFWSLALLRHWHANAGCGMTPLTDLPHCPEVLAMTDSSHCFARELVLICLPFRC